MKFGACISIQDIQEAKRFNYDYIELSGREIFNLNNYEWEDFKKKVGIKILGFNDYCDSNYPLIGPQVIVKKNEDYADLLLRRAHELGCQYIGIGAPNARKLPEDFSSEVARLQMTQFLTMITNKAKPYNITILYEALNPFISDFDNTFEDVLKTVDQVNSKNLKIVWDFYHSELSKDPFPLQNRDYIEHIHYCESNTKMNRLYPIDKNSVELKKLESILSEFQYDGNISIEADIYTFRKYGFESLNILKSKIKK